MAKEKLVFVCSNCGHLEPRWSGRCIECGEWNSFSEEMRGGSKPTGKSPLSSKNDTIHFSLESMSVSKEMKLSSGIAELDRVLGGGIVLGSTLLIGGEPGIGKSTLMLQTAGETGKSATVLYVSGEESADQIKLRSQRLKIDGKGISLFTTTSLNSVLDKLTELKPSVLIVDSIQTLFSPEAGAGIGSVSQIRHCAYELSQACRSTSTALILSAHVTKEGVIAGPKVLEHIVDTVLYFELGEGDLRLLRCSKNRFGSTDELAFFRMKENGLIQIEDIFSLFINRGGETPPEGIAAAGLYEGGRAIPVEIQALVTASKNSFSRTYSDKVDPQRVSRIAAVLEKILNISLSDRDIYINIAGGFRITDPGADLALASAIYSSRTGLPLKGGTLLCGEISLAGELRPVTHADKRLKCAQSAGFSQLVLPKQEGKPIHSVSLKEASSLKEAISILFNK